MVLQPLVAEAFLKQLVDNLYSQTEDHGPCDNMTQEEADARDEDFYMLQGAVATSTLQEVLICHSFLHQHVACLTMA